MTVSKPRWDLVLANRRLIGAFRRRYRSMMACMASEDVEQELLLAMARATLTWKPECGPYGPWAWLYMQHVARAALQAGRRHATVDLAAAPPPRVESAEAHVNARLDVQSALRARPPRPAEAVLLEELLCDGTQADAAERLGVSRSRANVVLRLWFQAAQHRLIHPRRTP